jgi:hypothetical protein
VSAGGASGAPDDGETLIEPRSGDVVQVRGTSVDGHPVSVQSIRDLSHDTACAVQRARDGTMRCLPPKGPLRVEYLDANCETPVAVEGSGVSCTDGVAHYALQESTGQCSAPGFAVFAVGAPIERPDHIYEANAFGCNELPRGSEVGYYDAKPSPASEWVAFEHHVEPVTSRLGVAYWTGNDGSRLIDGPWLLEQDAPCGQAMDETKVSRCFPTRRTQADSGSFTDDSCTTRVAATILCDAPELVNTSFLPSTPQCGITLTGTWFTTALMDSRVVYSSEGGMCARTKYGGLKYYAPSDPVHFDAFPPIERSHDGAKRIQRAFWSSEGAHLYADGLYDTKYSVECRPTTTKTGIVCAGDRDRAEAYFADAGCAVPLYAGDDCGAHPEFVMSGPEQACDPLIVGPVRLVLQVHSGPVFDGQAFGSPVGYCRPADSSTGVLFYDVGDPAQPEAVFESLETVRF